MSRDFISVTNLTITHLKQVVDRISTIKQEELIKVDQMINTYLLRRRQNKSSTQIEESFQTKIRSQLISLEQRNDYLLKELEIITKNYQKEQQEIKSANEFFNHQTEEINEENPLQELINQLLYQLTPFRKITHYLQKFEALKKEFKDRQRFANSMQEYFEKVNEIVGEDQTLDDLDNQQTQYTLQDYYGSYS